MSRSITTFRDLNKNGRLDPYEDPSRPVEERVADLLAQMTLAEKAGLLFHSMAEINPNGTLEPAPGPFGNRSITDAINQQHINHFNVHALPEPARMVEWHNRLQKVAEETRLGIPVTISSDPRHAFSENPLTNFMASNFSQWPEPLGLAAIGDEALVEEFGDIARQEYIAMGLRVALHPMIDLATEPRWARNNGTFGEDAHLSARLGAAYIRGFQGQTLDSESVACMTKHFPGGGPQMNGEDAHFPYGREQVYPGNNFDYHLIPFAAAFAAGTSQIMPYYGMPMGTQYEEVGFGFNRGVLTDLLRNHYGFDGIVCTDWGLITDKEIMGRTLMVACAWGVEHLSPAQRVKKALDAGVDQFGGENCPELVIELVESGQISEERIDESVRRLLREKFRLGLFDNPYLDSERAVAVVGKPEFRQAGELAQRKSIVLLKNSSTLIDSVLPIKYRPKLYVENLNREVVARYADVVETPAEAEMAILRLKTPFEQRSGDNFLESFFHAGDLDFKEPEKSRIMSILRQVPTIVDIYLDRPAVIPEIAERCAALLANFGASDEALLDVIFGKFAPTATLPFELPRSMEAVRQQKEDLPYDSDYPLYRFGEGLTYDSLNCLSHF